MAKNPTVDENPETNKYLDTPLAEFGSSIRLSKVLEQGDIVTVRDVVTRSEDDLWGIDYFNETSRAELKDILNSIGLDYEALYVIDKNQIIESDFGAGIKNGLIRAGVETIDELVQTRPEDLVRNGMGIATLMKLKDELPKYGLSLNDDNGKMDELTSWYESNKLLQEKLKKIVK